MSLALIENNGSGYTVSTLCKDTWNVFGVGYYDGKEVIVAGDTVDGNVSEPAILVFQKAKGKWRRAQSIVRDLDLGESRLPGTRFRMVRGRANPEVVIAHTRPYPNFLSTAHAGPHLHNLVCYKRVNGEFVLVYDRRLRTAMATLDDLASFRKKNDRRHFNALVPIHVRKALWKALESDGESAPEVGNITSNCDDDAKELVVNGELVVGFRWNKRANGYLPVWCYK